MSKTQKSLLSHAQFYVLLSLARAPLHGYAISGMVYNLSRTSINLPSGNLYPLLARMSSEGLIELMGQADPGTSSRPQTIYGITQRGLLTLKSELQRLEHAVKAARAAGLLGMKEPPLDIQALLLGLNE
jgi:DNA-binding PadR family transcriptional regulator